MPFSSDYDKQKPMHATLILTVFNGASFLTQALQSIERERGPGMEIIIVDDGSQDQSISLIEKWPFKVVRHQEQKGVAAARNSGLRHAQGEYLFFLDYDDVLAEGSLHRRLAWHREHPEAWAMAGQPAGIINAEGEVLRQYQHVLHPDYSFPQKLSLDFFRSGGAYPVACWNLSWKRTLFDEIGYFNEELTIGEDFDFLMRVLTRYPLAVLRLPTVWRRWHKHNISVDTTSRPRLRPETIAILTRLCHQYQIPVPHTWNLWESSYQPGQLDSANLFPS